VRDWLGIDGSGQLAQFGNPAHLNPFHNEDIPIVIEASTVRTKEFSRKKCCAGLLAGFTPFLLSRIVAIAQSSHHVVSVVKNYHLTL
jgi:hypothetical protein